MLKPTRTLATANRSRVSICVTQKMARPGGVVNPVKFPLIQFDHEFICCFAYMCAHVGNLKNLRTQAPLEWEGAWLTPRNTLLLHMYYLAEFGRSRLNGSSALTDIRWKKNLAHRVPLFKVIGIDTIRLATCDFLLVIHSNYGPISYRF